MILIYAKNIFLTGSREKVFEKLQRVPITSIISLVLDFRDLIDLDEENNYSIIICIWCIKILLSFYILKF